MDYYKEKIYLAAVDKSDTVLEGVERWEAHEKGILHRCFTVCLFFKDKIVMQHRKHPVFDGVFDLTCSSHPVFKNGKIQRNEEAVFETLEREWSVAKGDLADSPRGRPPVVAGLRRLPRAGRVDSAGRDGSAVR